MLTKEVHQSDEESASIALRHFDSRRIDPRHGSYLVPERKPGFFVKVKDGENFNRRNTGRAWPGFYGSISRTLETRPACGGTQTIQGAWLIFALSRRQSLPMLLRTMGLTPQNRPFYIGEPVVFRCAAVFFQSLYCFWNALFGLRGSFWG